MTGSGPRFLYGLHKTQQTDLVNMTKIYKDYLQNGGVMYNKIRKIHTKLSA